jgi:ubiquinone/menaquinone biosynthesis C-methylase UbiE
MSTLAATNTLTPNAWEAAYLRFETPDQEIRKFVKRLGEFGASQWPRDARIVELFCGRGNGLRALAQLNFTNIEGIDLSPALAAQFSGPGKVVVGDCRKLPYADESKDVLIVQGGLHHLPVLPGDLEATLTETRRVLKPGGLFCAVEPWLTPFLSFVHAICEVRAARRLSGKLDALATMIDHERHTYEQWLRQPQVVLDLLHRFFVPQRQFLSWGKLHFVGQKSRS